MSSGKDGLHYKKEMILHVSFFTTKFSSDMSSAKGGLKYKKEMIPHVEFLQCKI